MFNVDDTVTSHIWLQNQASAKPARYATIPWSYVTLLSRPPNEVHVVAPDGPPGSSEDLPRILTDPHEIMAFAARSISRSVGASNFAGGSVDSSVDLAGLIEGMSGYIYDLRDRHSAQFVYPVYMNYAFYREFLSQCGIAFNP
jgi:hypothetical protein